ncbi:hypothetical protein A1OQ_09035 [Enterovibrio norvegicus FF-162]|uniref:hypothetical protein n=1 Tax=Enterovibrio sp. FF113 TaxID=3230010 RepID=UPI000556EDB6|nr:hypothetical protein A1OQ_09035 [Enterovibrio norvegicus FF-162]
MTIAIIPTPLLSCWKQVAMQMSIAKEDMIYPDKLDDILLDIPCNIEKMCCSRLKMANTCAITRILRI